MKKVLVCLGLALALTVALAVLNHYLPLSEYWFVPAVALALLVWAMLHGALCARLAQHKGYTGYFWTGFWFGPTGLLYVVGLPSRRRSRYDGYLLDE